MEIYSILRVANIHFVRPHNLVKGNFYKESSTNSSDFLIEI